MHNRCQCEHVCHFGEPWESCHDDRAPRHLYGKAEAQHTLVTPYGIFNVCTACRDHCQRPAMDAGVAHELTSAA